MTRAPAHRIEEPHPSEDPAGAGKSMSQTQRAAVQLREMIVNNKLPAGSNYLETELAEMLNMSRTPVREAVVVLEAQGLVEVRPRRGIRILPLSAQDMEEIYEILSELEAVAAEHAAAKGMSPENREALERALADMDAALEVDDRDGWAEADRRFHNILVSLSDNRRLKAVVESFNDQVHRARMLTVRLRPAPKQSNRDHRALFEAILAGDGTEARRIHEEHRKAAMEVILGLLRQHGFHQV